MSDNALQKNILATVAYYDAMDYPLTSFEIWKYLTAIGQQSAIDNSKQYSLPDVISGLEGESIKKFIEEQKGFYFLNGRQELVEQRLEKNKIANAKLKKLIRVVGWLRCVPFVRMIAVTGSLAMKNADSDSDLDLLVVLKHGKIFTGRFLVTGLVHLLGKRRYKNKIADRVCLNYFITTASLEVGLKDLFSASEYFFILPVFGWHQAQKFQEANAWIGKYKPNFAPDEIPDLKFLPETFFSYRLRFLGEMIFNFSFIENILKKWQLRRIEKNPKTRQQGSMITAADDMLVFLPEPQGPKIFEKFKEKLISLG